MSSLSLSFLTSSDMIHHPHMNFHTCHLLCPPSPRPQYITDFCPLGRQRRIFCWLGGMNLDIPGQEAHPWILSIWFVSLPGFGPVAERDGGGGRIVCALGRLTWKLFDVLSFCFVGSDRSSLRYHWTLQSFVVTCIQLSSAWRDSLSIL